MPRYHQQVSFLESKLPGIYIEKLVPGQRGNHLCCVSVRRLKVSLNDMFEFIEKSPANAAKNLVNWRSGGKYLEETEKSSKGYLVHAMIFPRKYLNQILNTYQNSEDIDDAGLALAIEGSHAGSQWMADIRELDNNTVPVYSVKEGVSLRSGKIRGLREEEMKKIGKAFEETSRNPEIYKSLINTPEITEDLFASLTDQVLWN